MKKILILLILSLFICACSNKQMISKEEKLAQIMNEKEYIIVDVRTKTEYDSSHIVGALNIPYNEINKDTTLDKNKVIIVYFKSGNRSKIASDILTNLGYTTYDLGAFEEIDLPKE